MCVIHLQLKSQSPQMSLSTKGIDTSQSSAQPSCSSLTTHTFEYSTVLGSPWSNYFNVNQIESDPPSESFVHHRDSLLERVWYLSVSHIKNSLLFHSNALTRRLDEQRPPWEGPYHPIFSIFKPPVRIPSIQTPLFPHTLPPLISNKKKWFVRG